VARLRMLERGLVDTCSVLRATTVSDGFGLPEVVSWEEVAEDVPCRLIRKRRWVYQPQTGQGTLVDECLLYLSVDTDVQLGDRVSVDGDQYEVDAIVPRRDSHLRLELKRWENTS